MTDTRGRRGREPETYRTHKRITRYHGRSELKPPDPYRCYLHDSPDKFTCPTCVSHGEAMWEMRGDF